MQAQERATAGNSPITSVSLGQSVIALKGPWKFHIGDDPRWGDPDYDDSSWESVDLGSKSATAYSDFSDEYVPGWTAHGHAGYTGYAWYRLKVRVQDSNGSLALVMPDNVDDAYRIYVNRRIIGYFGNFTRKPPKTYMQLAEWFPLPAIPPLQVVTFAVQIYMRPGTLFTSDARLLVGGMHGAPRIGISGSIAALGKLARASDARAAAMGIVLLIISLGFAFTLLTLWSLDRTERVYLWLSIAYFIEALFNGLNSYWAANIAPMADLQLIAYILVVIENIALFTALWLWFQLGEYRWLIRAAWLLSFVWYAPVILVSPPFDIVTPYSWLGDLYSVVKVGRLSFGLLFTWMIILAIRRRRDQAWLLLPSAALYVIPYFSSELALLHIPTSWTISGVSISLSNMLRIGLSASLGVLVIRRFQLSQRRRLQLETDLRQAQQVQRLLVPQAIPQPLGFSIECEYRPAQEVGGDFFQVLDMATGGVLVVIGDVSGKGLSAAMTVALIVGTLRTLAEQTASPAAILGGLNRRLEGRGTGFTTCLIAFLRPDGEGLLANAGHLPPYRNGEEVEMASNLPLGLSENSVYVESPLVLRPKDCLTFVSDGVVEAKNGQGELFGFERTRLNSMQSAEAIATAAKHFGQEDDITVLTVEYRPLAMAV